MTELWEKVAIPGFYYEVSSYGRVRNSRTGRILKPVRTGSTRSQTSWTSSVYLCAQGVTKRYTISRLVLSAFVGPPNKDAHAMHLDDDHSNNALSNLRWGSPSDNATDMAKKTRGGKQILDVDAVQQICYRRRNGESGKNIAAAFGVSQQRVCDIYKGRTRLLQEAR